MAKKNIQALTTQLAVHEMFGQFRYLKKDDGEIYFAGKDVAKILGYKDTDQAIRDHVDAEDKELLKPADLAGLKNSTYPVDLTGLKIPNRGLIFINESGLYSLIFNSQLPTAKKFKRWVTSEVLPSIRKYGYYGIEQSDKPKENLLEDWKPTGTFEDVATVTNILDEKGIEYDYDITAITFEYNEQLGMICQNYNFKLKIKD